MRRFVLTGFILMAAFSVFAQQDTTTTIHKRVTTTTPALPRANDHFMLQFGYAGWVGKTSAMRTTGFSHSFNAYFLFDFPFKTNPHFSVAIGPGIGTDNIYFSKTYVGIRDLTTTLQFRDLTDSNHFKTYKLATAYAEAPVELRFTLHPDDNNHSFKVAIGAKVGAIVNAHTKGKSLQSSTGSTLDNYIEKENSTHYFNTTRLVGTARIGFGHFSLYGTYQINSLFKDGVAPTINPYTMGLTISGL